MYYPKQAFPDNPKKGVEFTSLDAREIHDKIMKDLMPGLKKYKARDLEVKNQAFIDHQDYENKFYVVEKAKNLFIRKLFLLKLLSDFTQTMSWFRSVDSCVTIDITVLFFNCLHSEKSCCLSQICGNFLIYPSYFMQVFAVYEDAF